MKNFFIVALMLGFLWGLAFLSTYMLMEAIYKPGNIGLLKWIDGALLAAVTIWCLVFFVVDNSADIKKPNQEDFYNDCK